MTNRLYNSSHIRPILNQCWAAPCLCIGELPKVVTLVAKSLFYAVYSSAKFNHESGRILTFASCFCVNVMIWHQCVCSLWSSNSFYVTHHDSLLVLFPLSFLSHHLSLFIHLLLFFFLSTHYLPPFLSQLQHEKAELEQHLEQEQEFQVNKLMKKIKKMENETISKQLTLEQVSWQSENISPNMCVQLL